MSVVIFSLAWSKAVFPSCILCNQFVHPTQPRTACTHLALDIDIHPSISQQNLNYSSVTLHAGIHESSPSKLQEDIKQEHHVAGRLSR